MPESKPTARLLAAAKPRGNTVTATFENWFMVFVVVMTLAVMIQMGIFIAMFLGTRQFQRKIEKLIDRDVQPLLGEARSLIADGRKTVANLNATTEDIAGFAHTQSGRLDGLFGEAVERARLQLVRADDIFTDALSRVEMTTEQVHQTVTGPIREIQAILAGVRTAFEFLGGKRRPRGPVQRSTADEEMFI
jgi:hypothetical protein